MILVDTNVISETMRPGPDPQVLAWLDEQAAETLHVCTTSLAELFFGVAALPDGRRKTELHRALEQALALFGPRALSFDVPAARAYAEVAARARAEGRPIGVADGQIAGVAAAHKLTVATRDTGPFEAAGLLVIDPWKVSS